MWPAPDRVLEAEREATVKKEKIQGINEASSLLHYFFTHVFSVHSYYLPAVTIVPLPAHFLRDIVTPVVSTVRALARPPILTREPLSECLPDRSSTQYRVVFLPYSSNPIQ
eukprot:sb/3477136/